MKIKCAIISRSTLKKIKAFVRSAKKFEIGGPMVGFMSQNDLVITDLDGPGINGKLNTFSVTVDGEHSKEFCDFAYFQSGRLIDYVGDWHCHPSICIRPSKGDEQAIATMAKSPGLTTNPLSLIYGSVIGRFKIYQWDQLKSCLIPITHKVVDQAKIEQLIIEKNLGALKTTNLFGLEPNPPNIDA